MAWGGSFSHGMSFGVDKMVQNAYVAVFEIPYAVMLRRRFTDVLGEDVVKHIVAFLPDVHKSTFSNTAKQMVNMHLCWSPVWSRRQGGTLNCLLTLRSVSNPDSDSVVMKKPSRVALAWGLRTQIMHCIGIDSFSNLRLVRLVGEGPWERSASTCYIRKIMEDAFDSLLAASTGFSGLALTAFLTDLARLNRAWSRMGWHVSGVHGWDGRYWKMQIYQVYEDAGYFDDEFEYL